MGGLGVEGQGSSCVGHMRATQVSEQGDSN